MDRKTAIRLHRKMWRWLAENPNKEKENWPEWEWNGGRIAPAIAFCFACEFACGDCNKCPFVWGGKGVCVGKGGPYRNWMIAVSHKKRSKLALKIANLPVRRTK